MRGKSLALPNVGLEQLVGAGLQTSCDLGQPGLEKMTLKAKPRLKAKVGEEKEVPRPVEKEDNGN